MCDRASRLSAGDADYWGGQLSDWELNHREGRLRRKLAVLAVPASPSASARPGRRFARRT